MITDDDLILYYYRDGLDAAERARIGAALAEQSELAQRLHKLVGKLDAAAAIPEVPVPQAFQQRWRAALDQAAQGQTTRAVSPKRHHFTPWLAAAAVAVLAIGVVFQVREPALQQPPITLTPPATGAYERGLASHLASTQQQLVALENATPEERKRLVDTIIEQNRIYALAADRAGEPQLARVLRAFTPILEGLEEGDTSANLDQLEFELRVMQGRLATGRASASHSTTL